jgi:GTP-binding protein SAR1
MSAILDFFRNIFYSLGLFKKNAKIVFLGLDNAGKSTLLTLLSTGRITQLNPTKHS